MNEVVVLGQVILIDVCLSGDNAMVIGMVAAGLAERQRRAAIALGIGIAIAFRIVFSLLAVRLLNVPWLSLVGGTLLLWVCWTLFRDLRTSEADAHNGPAATTLAAAIYTISIADISMSLDNVLAVAAASREHPIIMVFGLVLSISFMVTSATLIARLLTRWPWLHYAGLALIFYVASSMIVADLIK